MKAIAVEWGKRIGIYFETDADLEVFKTKLKAKNGDTHAQVFPATSPFGRLGDMPVIVADADTWTLISSRQDDLIMRWRKGENAADLAPYVMRWVS